MNNSKAFTAAFRGYKKELFSLQYVGFLFIKATKLYLRGAKCSSLLLFHLFLNEHQVMGKFNITLKFISYLLL